VLRGNRLHPYFIPHGTRRSIRGVQNDADPSVEDSNR